MVFGKGTVDQRNITSLGFYTTAEHPKTQTKQSNNGFSIHTNLPLKRVDLML